MIALKIVFRGFEAVNLYQKLIKDINQYINKMKIEIYVVLLLFAISEPSSRQQSR